MKLFVLRRNGAGCYTLRWAAPMLAALPRATTGWTGPGPCEGTGGPPASGAYSLTGRSVVRYRSNHSRMLAILAMRFDGRATIPWYAP